MDLLSNQENKNVELPGDGISFLSFDSALRQDVLDRILCQTAFGSIGKAHDAYSALRWRDLLKPLNR